MPDVTNLEGKNNNNKKNRRQPDGTEGQSDQVSKYKKKEEDKNQKHVFCYQSPTGLLPLLPKRILIKFLVVGFVPGIVTRMVTTLEWLLSNGLRAPVLIIGLATLGIWLVVPISFALSSYISTAATPSTTYPSSPSRLHASSRATPAAAWSRSPALREVGPASGCPGAAASSGRRAPAPGASAAAPPPRGGLEVVVPVVRVVVAAAVVVIVIAVVVIVILVRVVVRGVRVAAPVAASASTSDRRGHVGRGRVVVIVIVPEEREKAPNQKHGENMACLSRDLLWRFLHLCLGRLPLGFTLLPFLIRWFGKNDLNRLPLQLLPIHLLQSLQEVHS